MAKFTRSERREKVFELLFESEFRSDEEWDDILAAAIDERDFGQNEYIQKVYLGIRDNLEEIDGIIGRHAKGWKTNRLSRVSRAIIRLCVFEMKYMPDIPNTVAINEAVELSKKFDEVKARPFVNGVLNSIKQEIETAGKQ